MRALLIAHETSDGGGEIERRLVERGLSVDTHVVTKDFTAPNQAEPWPELAGYDLLVLMGSIRSLTNKAEIDSWIYDELELVEKAHNADLPILGVCFGAQLLADALGGKVEKAPVPEIGWLPIEDGPDGANPAGPGPWMQWHFDRVVPPDGAEVLAVSDHAVQLFKIGRSVASQFHPEVDVEHVSTWINSVDDPYFAKGDIDPDAMLEATKHHEAANRDRCHAYVDWFLDEVGLQPPR